MPDAVEADTDAEPAQVAVAAVTLFGPVGIGGLSPVVTEALPVVEPQPAPLLDQVGLAVGEMPPGPGMPRQAGRTRTCAAEISPVRNAARVSGIERSRRASRTSPPTGPRGSRPWTAIQSVADRDPSSAYTCRASNAAVCSATTAANRACSCRNDSIASASSASDTAAGIDSEQPVDRSRPGPRRAPSPDAAAVRRPVPP